MDLARLLTIPVKCNGKPTKAIVDTGASASIISPKLARECKMMQVPWSGASFTLANGERVRPEAAGCVEIALGNGQAIKTAVAIMEMGNINLLLGNDALRRFKELTIKYQQQDGAPEVTLGEFGTSPEVEQLQQETKKKKMAVRYDQMVPAKTTVAISVGSQDLKPGMAALVEPVESLQWKKD